MPVPQGDSTMWGKDLRSMWSRVRRIVPVKTISSGLEPLPEGISCCGASAHHTPGCTGAVLLQWGQVATDTGQCWLTTSILQSRLSLWIFCLDHHTLPCLLLL